MNNPDRIWVLMGKKLSGSIVSTEEQELERLLFENPELWYSYELLQAVMSLDDVPAEFINEINSLLDSKSGAAKFNSLLEEKLHTHDEVPESSFFSKYKRHSLVLAGIVLVGCSVWFWPSFNTPVVARQEIASSSTNEIVAPKGSKTQITLADGTQIWLNAGSKLVYSKNFSMENREVFLDGEAYFKVVHHDKHAFIVHTPEATIRDLGTTFNVKAYSGSPTTETTLIEGSVEIVLKSSSKQKILIQPNEKLVLHNQENSPQQSKNIETASPIFEVSKIVPFSATNDIIETAWVSDKLIFRDRSFEDLVIEMERHYDVDITVEGETLKKQQVTGIFRNESIGEALKILQEIIPFKLTINNQKILINE
jgi:ferric-dicitrate binding protein FerR (iron transport regulator)